MRAGHNEEDNWEDNNILRMEDILEGHAFLDISHGGSEFVDLAELMKLRTTYSDLLEGKYCD